MKKIIMKTIHKNNDLVFELELYDTNNQPINTDDLKGVDIEVFTLTTTEENYIKLNKQDITDNTIHIDNSQLQKLNEGILYVVVHLVFYDSEFPDGSYDYTTKIETNYYINE
ncbi:hypothetical protein [Bacteroides congonensis]|uniref:hypothetical protein n=1 Tax=Bacteroides congonensis TaxID=1871006 RepID=UPI001114DFAE|nr:hypothetical protein [Bacteroides congonensis]